MARRGEVPAERGPTPSESLSTDMLTGIFVEIRTLPPETLVTIPDGDDGVLSCEARELEELFHDYLPETAPRNATNVFPGVVIMGERSPGVLGLVTLPPVSGPGLLLRADPAVRRTGEVGQGREEADDAGLGDWNEEDDGDEDVRRPHSHSDRVESNKLLDSESDESEEKKGDEEDEEEEEEDNIGESNSDPSASNTDEARNGKGDDSSPSTSKTRQKGERKGKTGLSEPVSTTIAKANEKGKKGREIVLLVKRSQSTPGSLILSLSQPKVEWHNRSATAQNALPHRLSFDREGAQVDVRKPVIVFDNCGLTRHARDNKGKEKTPANQHYQGEVRFEVYWDIRTGSKHEEEARHNHSVWDAWLARLKQIVPGEKLVVYGVVQQQQEEEEGEEEEDERDEDMQDGE